MIILNFEQTKIEDVRVLVFNLNYLLIVLWIIKYS